MRPGTQTLAAVLVAPLMAGCVGIADFQVAPEAREPPAADAGAIEQDGGEATDAGPDAGRPGWDGMGPFPGPCVLEVTADTTELNGANRRISYTWNDQLRIVQERIDFESDDTTDLRYDYTWEDAGTSFIPCAPYGGPYHVRLPAEDYRLFNPPYASVAAKEACGSSGTAQVSARPRTMTEVRPPRYGQTGLQKAVYAYRYDEAGRMVDVDRSFDPPRADWPVPSPHDYAEFQYDSAGRITLFAERYTSVGDVNGKYRPGLNRYAFSHAVSSVTLSVSSDYDTTTRMEKRGFDAQDRLEREESTGTVWTAVRNERGDIVQARTTWSGGGETIYAIDYEYDAQGRWTQRIEKLGNSQATLEPRTRWKYTYNERGNLARVDQDVWWFTDQSWHWAQSFEFRFGCWAVP